MKTPFKTSFDNLSFDIQSAMQAALIQVVKDTKETAANRMIAAFDESAAKELFPHDEMTAEEREENARQWAMDAVCNALKGLNSTYVHNQIVESIA